MSLVRQPGNREVWVGDGVKVVRTGDRGVIYRGGDATRVSSAGIDAFLHGRVTGEIEPEPEPELCTHHKLIGGVCGRERPCRYHDKD